MKTTMKLAVFLLFLFVFPFSANAEVDSNCGDKFCDNLLGESESSCPADCAVDVVVPFCGDKFCDNLLGEDESSCPADCALPPVVPPAVNTPPKIVKFDLPSSFEAGSDVIVKVNVTDDFGVASIEFSDALRDTGIVSVDCKGKLICETVFSFFRTPKEAGAAYSYTLKATDSHGLTTSMTKSGVTTSPFQDVSFYKCSADRTKILRCDVSAVSPDAGLCSDADYVVDTACLSSQRCEQSFVDKTIKPMCNSIFSAPAPAPVAPIAPANNLPSINSFSVPAAADKNADVTLSVSASDSDGGVNRIEILKDGAIVASQPCGNVFSCTRSFIVRVPDAFSAVYVFVARVFDSLSAVATASGSGVTNPAPVVTPPQVTPPEPEMSLESVKVSIPSDELFISSIVPDTGCLAPGAETFLYVSLKNSGRRNVDDVKITAIVADLDVRAVSGPFRIRKGDSASRLLYFMIPEDAKPGDYYIRVSVTSGKDSAVKYRIFEVNKAC